ncbi:MAG: CidA/LrgA family protein [Aquabacterium sp.]|mgnify:FL=1|jgi:holin-like protein|uniref:CidA/LrgA family protein n=1 Tax=Aquabacterium sp. TaxID=1872578 RepID=UPI001B71D846|nr:CidA/LrgA family protein [Aquabacterium sp.]MBP7132853.1 CidA/LrgA family protein [Aquabacterium sp.]MBP9063431.1 CidA/LrgA family protein [Aquabacterium sp.]MDQ5926830.1 holin-like protein [Pseudomonadota bacterium]
MIQGLALLVAGQLMGEATVAVTGLPVPGSVVGMVLVLLALLMKKGQLPELRRAGSTMLLLVPLLLVPISVGIMEQTALLRANWLPLTVALLVSVAAGMAATVLTIRWLARSDAKQVRDV